MLATPSVLGRAARAETAPRTRPRFYLQIIPCGGMDAVYTTDPKTAKEVSKGIDVPYAASAISDAGGLRLAPSFKALARWSSRLAVVNMFRQNAANHQGGLAHATRFKNRTTSSMPTLFDVLGARRQGISVGAVSIGADFETGSSPGYLGEPGTYYYSRTPSVFGHLDRAKPDDLRTAARVLQAQANALGHRRLSAAQQTTADNLLASAHLFEHVASSPKFAPAAWEHKLESYIAGAPDVQRALWLFENQLARCVTVSVGRLIFDSHTSNAIQLDATNYLASLLDRLFTELDSRKVDGRPLSEQTVVIIGSEIGRFPRLNDFGGKDHFPQVPYLLFGSQIKTGVYGGTNRDMLSLPVSLTTGQPEASGQFLQLDDLGTTLLRLEGVNPQVYGYTGNHLPFLVS